MFLRIFIWLVGALLCTHSVSAGSAEGLFKEAAEKVAAMDQQAIKKGEPGPEWVQHSLACRDILKKVVTAEPKGLWADDAQYLVGVLSLSDKTQVVEKEKFLILFPSGSAEDWTKERLSYIVPSKLPLDLAVRMELAMDYMNRGDTDKLKTLADESGVKYPERKTFFETLVRRSQTS